MKSKKAAGLLGARDLAAPYAVALGSIIAVLLILSLAIWMIAVARAGG